MSDSHRLHYRWAQLEADRYGINVGSPGLPMPSADREMRLRSGCEFSCCPVAFSERKHEQSQFSFCNWLYQSIHYNTFCKNGSLKLTEVELYFLSSLMTRTSSCGWAIVYLGIGTGDRFRCLRDEFFPDLSVVGFDPIDQKYKHLEDYARENARIWNSDGTNFEFHVRCFDCENDPSRIRERFPNKKIALISDIRGTNFLDDGVSFDKACDQEIQWKAIQRICPCKSLVKFTPESDEQFFLYAPGKILKQVFDNYGTCEMRLLIDGCPQQKQRYNGWEMYEKMMFHHEHLRGQMYELPDRPDGISCLDSCFDCSVLWNTLCTYAEQNSLNVSDVFAKILRNHIYTPSHDDAWAGSYDTYVWKAPSCSQRWWDVEWSLQRGKLTEAIAALEVDGEVDEENLDWIDIAKGLYTKQPALAQRVKRSLNRPASRKDLIHLLRSLSKPFTPIYTDQNYLLTWHGEKDVE